MKLDGTKREILRKGIIGAYSSPDELEICLSEKMDVQLSVIARGENYNTKVFSLIQDFEADGRIEEFIRVIVKEKPNSPYLAEILKEFPDIVAGFTGKDYTGNTINRPKPNIDLLQFLIDYFSHCEKPGQHLKSLIEISDIKIDIAAIDYNLSVRELITSFYARLITNEDNYLSFLKVLQSQLPSYSDERSFINNLIQQAEKKPQTSPESIKTSIKANFFAYDEAWVGRKNLIDELTNKVRSSCRLLILVGLTGIGKTALSERLAVDLEDWFLNWNYYLQVNFDNDEQTSDFASVAARLLEKCKETVTSDDRKDTQRLMNRLVKHLQENRYLVQIDSLENLLQGNEEEGWNDFKDEWWVKFFQTYLNVDSCESCFILTSQDLPTQIPTIGTRAQNFWYCQPLRGLDEPEQLELFKKTGLDVGGTAEGKPYLERIGRAYEGHPLALRVIAGEIINKPFNGNVLGYWKKYRKEVEEVEKAIEEAKNQGITASADDQFNLHKYTRNLRRNVKVRLEKTFNRLKEEVQQAYLLLCESSVYRCEVPEDFWLSHLEDWDIDEDGQQKALDALRDRYLVEERVDENHQYLLRQHNLIRSVSLEHLRQLGEENEQSS